MSGYLSLPPKDPLHHNRSIEWALAWAKIGGGMWLLRPGATMDAPNFRVVLSMADEWAWGLAAVCLGLWHVVALVINGRRGWTPGLRSVANFLAIGGYSALSVGFFVANDLSLGAYIFGVAAILHGWCWTQAVGDATQVYLRRRSRDRAG